MTITPQAAGRLALLCLLGGTFQLTTVSQVSIFGVPADLSPLLVASVGFLTGSISGAVFGFSLGLFVDTVLLQTLGVNSLVLTAVGYGAGRVRELRDPAHTLAPVLVGADRHRAGGHRLLAAAVPARRRGPDLAPAPARDPDDDRAQHAARPARVRRLPPGAAPVPARRPAPPPAPRVHDRRAEPVVPWLSRSRSAGPRSRRSSRCASPCSAGSRSWRSRSSSSGCGSCRSCRARTTSRRRATTACARCGSRRRAATSSTATAPCW